MSTLLVIGNGFDLSVGANTSYDHFFTSDYYKDIKQEISTLIAEFKISRRIIYNHDDLFNCWDVLFFIESRDIQCNNKDIDWCDIEKVIHDSFINSRKSFSWNKVYDCLHKYYESGNVAYLRYSSDTIKIELMINYLKEIGWRKYCDNLEDFYSQLLRELNIFEKRFGKYISNETRKETYCKAAQEFIKTKFASSVLIIDSFNYSDFLYNNNVIRHINGDCNNPIFGIDNSEKEKIMFSSNSYIFTKTSRRLYQDAHNLNSLSVWKESDIEKAIVFGHSLNQMDYDYFNYLFTLLRFHTFDIDKMGCIEFAYRVYNDDKKIKIRNDYAENIYSLLNYYENYVSKTEQHILINMLIFSGKLRIYEV